MMRYLLVLVLLASCGGDFGDPLFDWPTAEAEALAEVIVADTLIDHGYDDPRPMWVYFYDGCIPEFWQNFGIGEADTECRRAGKAYVLPWHCFIAVKIRGDRLSTTSYAHEAGHCSEVDAFHKDRRLWDVVEPEAIRRLQEAGQ